jgi:hypothetical protein
MRHYSSATIDLESPEEGDQESQFRNVSGPGGVAQRWGTCLPCAKPWAPPSAPEIKKEEGN